MSDLLERLGVELPVVQAGMGGGLAGHELAAAVSEAGGLGTLGMQAPRRLEAELAAARRLTGRPLAVNVLLPFARRAHWPVAARADLVVTFWGRARRRTPGPWAHQVGSVEEALAARAAGADAVIPQGAEAGGHVRGSLPSLELLERVRRTLGPEYPILLAGGIAEAADLRRALGAGAAAAVMGTRFLATDECRAHPRYKQRLCDESETLLTELFGLGWPGPHRVLANAATDRWCGRDPRGPTAVRALNRLTAPVMRRLPEVDAIERQRPGVPFLSPLPPLADSPASTIEAAALYAGQTVARVDGIRPAAALVAELTGTPAPRQASRGR